MTPAAAGVFFTGATPSLRRVGPPPYRDCGEHLDDELSRADLLLSRLPVLRALKRDGGSAGALTAAARQLSEIDARAAALRSYIEEREAITPPTAQLALPLLTSRWALSRTAKDTLILLFAIELDPRRLAAALDPCSGTTPLFLTPGLLYEILVGAEGPPRQRWLAYLCGPDSLLEQRLVLRADEGSAAVPFGAAPLRLHPQLLSFLLHGPQAFPTSDGLSRLHPAGAHTELSADEQRLVPALSGAARGHCLWVVGPEKHGTGELVERLSAAAGRPLLEVDLETLISEPGLILPRIEKELRLLQRLYHAILLVCLGPGLGEAHKHQTAVRALRLLGAAASGPVVTVSEQAGPELAAVLGGTVCYKLPALTMEQRQRLWRRSLHQSGVRMGEPQLRGLADLPLGWREMVEVLNGLTHVRGDGEPLSFEAVQQAAVERLGLRLNRLADLVVTGFSWRDLVLPEEELYRLEEIVLYQQHRHQVLTTWNMGSKLPYGRGITALFSGPPGTGKTMAASVIANVLGRELHRVDLSRVVDKYVGETEKNLGAIFDAAAEAHAVLLFDEADSLFARRTSVGSSNDRYANLETAYLLQRMEHHSGISILTTNQLTSIDRAFMRRIQFKVEFPFPDADARAKIWEGSFPPELPLSEDVDCMELGRRYEISGGHIRSAVLRAAYYAAGNGQPVTMAALCEAGRIECETLGMLVSSYDAAHGER
jgi:hypothetical protein